MYAQCRQYHWRKLPNAPLLWLRRYLAELLITKVLLAIGEIAKFAIYLIASCAS